MFLHFNRQKMRIQVLANILISAATAAAIMFLMQGNKTVPLHPMQTVYERVISSGTLRCGYFAEAPFTIIDPNSGRKSGIAVEVAERIAGKLGVKLEWVSAENFTALTEDLNNGRYDAICASVYNLPRAGRIDYTIPYAYAPVFAYERKQEARFDGKLNQVDWAQVSVAGRDGEGATTIAREKIPNAKFVILPESEQISEMLTSVANRKADMVFVSPAIFKSFDINNRGQLKRVAGAEPFHVFNVSFGIKPDEAGFKNVLDFMLRNMMTSGELEQIFRKYDPDNLLMQPQALYRMQSAQN
jgi:ABC-type amino acid transport substrate-binding protein